MLVVECECKIANLVHKQYYFGFMGQVSRSRVLHKAYQLYIYIIGAF